MLSSCDGILAGVYDEAPDETEETVTLNGELAIDASSWTDWHFIDLDAVHEHSLQDPLYNPSSAWQTLPISTESVESVEGYRDGIYTYWYDVFGQGISKREYRDYLQTAPQATPDSWTFAVHRNNVMTNGCSVAATDYSSIAELPDDNGFTSKLRFEADSWNESDVWVIQERMLLGLIGCQGIKVNDVLSSWLTVDIPPMPPSFTLDSRVFVLRTPEGRYAAIQLTDYQSATGKKCVLKISYKYPL